MNPIQNLVLPIGWKCYLNEQGYPYYYNKEKQVSQWDYPYTDQQLPQTVNGPVQHKPLTMFTPEPIQPVVQTQATVVFMQSFAPQSAPTFLPASMVVSDKKDSEDSVKNDDQFQVEGEYGFTKEDGITVKKTSHGVSVYGLESSDQCVAFIQKNKVKPGVLIVATGKHTTGTGKNRHTVTDLIWKFDISDFLAELPSFENCDWDAYFESERILKKVQVEKVINSVESAGTSTFSLNHVTGYLLNAIPWPRIARDKTVQFQLIKPRISIKPDNSTRACCSTTNCVMCWIPCFCPCSCGFMFYRMAIDKEMPKPKLRYDILCSQEELIYHVTNAIPVMGGKRFGSVKLAPHGDHQKMKMPVLSFGGMDVI